jgi:hypothetical protein
MQLYGGSNKEATVVPKSLYFTTKLHEVQLIKLYCFSLSFESHYIYIYMLFPRMYPYFDVVVGLVWSHDPKSYAGGSVCYW